MLLGITHYDFIFTAASECVAIVRTQNRVKIFNFCHQKLEVKLVTIRILISVDRASTQFSQNLSHAVRMWLEPLVSNYTQHLKKNSKHL